MVPEDNRPTPRDVETEEPCDPVMARVRRRVAAGREALGLAPELLDAICGLREGTVARLEAGRSRIGPSHLFRLANAFKVGIDWFFDAADPLPPPLTADCSTAPTCADTRRFLMFYARLHNQRVREEIRMLVSAIAQDACASADTRLPLRPGELPPDP
jgi:transcriptional regulator with XRE-family HTH domain